MSIEYRAEVYRPLDRKFWFIHLVMPLAVMAVVLFSLEHTGIDLWLADWWYAMEGQQWLLRDHWLTYDVIHHYGKQLIIGFGLVLVTLLAASFRFSGLRRWRQPLAYLVTSMVLLPTLIAFSKRFSSVPCPWDLARYGGDAVYRHNLSYPVVPTELGHCFPAGHASGGFALLALYFAAYASARFPAVYLLPGFLVGVVFALAQQARGAHFISHDLWTLSICWFGVLGLYVLFRPQTWPRLGDTP